MLKVTNLCKRYAYHANIFGKTTHWIEAAQNVTFTLDSGQTLALVGESGSGKTTVGRCILRLLEPTSGDIVWKDNHISQLAPKQLKKMRHKMQVVFQDPYSSLNPRLTIRATLAEPFRIAAKIADLEINAKITKLLDLVGIAKDALDRYPHEFSGGQRQRIGIARSLALDPEFLLLDEPVSALDVSVQAQIINLLQDLKIEKKLTYLFISHDLAVVQYISDFVAVMYLGQIVEIQPCESLFSKPMHPYTEALLASIPKEHPNDKNAGVLLGEIPSPIQPPSGCSFHPRCIKADAVCSQQAPPVKITGSRSWYRCHF